jgi:hypothetical protein
VIRPGLRNRAGGPAWESVLGMAVVSLLVREYVGCPNETSEDRGNIFQDQLRSVGVSREMLGQSKAKDRFQPRTYFGPLPQMGLTAASAQTRGRHLAAVTLH